MSVDPRPRPANSIGGEVCRVVIALLVVFVVWIAWRIARPTVLHELACLQIGRASDMRLIRQAIFEGHPEIPWKGHGVESGGSGIHAIACGSERTPYVLASLSLGLPFTYLFGSHYIFDGRLRQTYSYTGDASETDFVGDCVGDENLEIVLKLTVVDSSCVMDDRSAQPLLQRRDVTQTWAFCSLGRSRNRLLAVVSSPATYGARPRIIRAIGIDRGDDASAGIDFVGHERGPVGWIISDELRFRPTPLGVMTYDGPPPPGYFVWVAGTPDEVTFAPDESIDDVVERLLEAIE